MAATTTETLADKDAIRELLADYCFHLDNEKFEEMAALFAPEGIWQTAFGTATGRGGIVAQARRIANGPRPRRVHLNSNVVIELGADTAAVRSYWTLVQNSSTGPLIGSGGAYQDHLVKQNGRWFFQHRTIDRFIADDKS